MAEARPKIAVVAYACEPDKGSEPGVGWNFVLGMSQWADLWVVTRANNKEAILKASAGTDERIRWLFVDLPAPLPKLKKRLPGGTHLYYRLWQWAARNRLAWLLRDVDLDVVHHLTFGSSWMAPPALLLPVPAVWGPIGGGDGMPMRFLRRERLPSIARELSYQAMSLLLPRAPLAALLRRRLKAVLFRSRSVAGRFPATPGAKRYVISETASVREVVGHERPERMRALCVGRLQYWKGFRYAIEGFAAYLDAGGAGELVILGDGPEMGVLRRHARRLGCEKSVVFAGRVSPEVVDRELQQATVLLHPSFRDGGSWSVVEALSRGVPVIALGASGVADMVTDASGIVVPLSAPADVVRRIGCGLTQLQADRGLWSTLSDGAKSRVQSQYRWPVRHHELRQVYADALSDDLPLMEKIEDAERV